MHLTNELIQNKVSSLASNDPNWEEQELQKCTFKPKINELKKDMQTAQIYTSINAFERLSKPLNQLLPLIEGQDPGRGELSQQTPSEEIANTVSQFGKNLKEFQLNSQLSDISSRSHLPPSEGFSERQQKFLRDKEERLEKIKSEMDGSVKAVINGRSKVMVEENKSTFEDRNSILLEKQRSRMLNEGVQELEGCTFHPQITKLGAKQRAKQAEEICYGDFVRKQKMIDELS
mmetsp:Transcript_12044/g.11917  ORF Transcript_12044/g.11917 Transcript_12044/m.11917 type:complete len:232 (+) Transcript_12044:1312-2007(+)